MTLTRCGITGGTPLAHRWLGVCCCVIYNLQNPTTKHKTKHLKKKSTLLQSLQIHKRDACPFKIFKPTKNTPFKDSKKHHLQHPNTTATSKAFAPWSCLGSGASCWAAGLRCLWAPSRGNLMRRSCLHTAALQRHMGGGGFVEHGILNGRFRASEWRVCLFVWESLWLGGFSSIDWRHFWLFEIVEWIWTSSVMLLWSSKILKKKKNIPYQPGVFFFLAPLSWHELRIR